MLHKVHVGMHLLTGKVHLLVGCFGIGLWRTDHIRSLGRSIFFHTVAMVVSILLVRVPTPAWSVWGNFRELVALETWFWWFLGLGSVLREYVLLCLRFLAVCDGRRVLAALLLYVVVVVVIIVIIVTYVIIITKTVVE